jgi:hypothetical protein
VIERLAADLHEAFPDMKGFSPRNLKYMRAFAAAWRDPAIVQRLAARIPWFHNCLLLDRASDPEARPARAIVQEALAQVTASPSSAARSASNSRATATTSTCSSTTSSCGVTWSSS